MIEAAPTVTDFPISAAYARFKRQGFMSRLRPVIEAAPAGGVVGMTGTSGATDTRGVEGRVLGR